MSGRLNEVERTWCPGCGDFAILDAVAAALDELGLEPEQVAVVSGIGQAGKLPHYLHCNFLHGLHGRALAHALGVRLASPELTVIAVGGDGDIYGEGGNHLLHAFRRNPDIACVVHNNGVYGLTKGQPAPTGAQGAVTRLSPHGTAAPAFNPLAAALAAGATFVARGFAGAAEQLAGIIAAAVRHRGFGFVDVLQPCVSFNRVNTWQWYRERVEPLADGHDPVDLDAAFRVALEWPGGERIPTGIIYRVERAVFEDGFPALRDRPGRGPGPDHPHPSLPLKGEGIEGRGRPARLNRLAEEFR
ncbi:MAG: thiamine pyrophosphate-dependent enzyme [bacterium]